MKKMLHLALAFVFCLCLLPACASAADKDFYIDEKGVLWDYKGSGGDVVIPDGVTSIGYYAYKGAFSDCKTLTSVTIPDSVTSIEMEAFRDCTSLTSVTIPDSVTSIGFDAFAGCTSLTSVTIPDSVTEIQSGAFASCTALTSVTIPGSVKEFFLNDVHRSGTFGNCTSLTSVNILDGFSKITEYTFRGCTALTSVTIPDSVTEIRNEAFKDCTSLTSVTIPNSVEKIGVRAFSGCTSLADVNVSADVSYATLEKYGMDLPCILPSDVYNDTPWLKAQGDFLIINNKLLEYLGEGESPIIIPDGVTYIASSSLSKIGKRELTIPSSVTYVNTGAFSGFAGYIEPGVIHCAEGSAAHQFAKENNIKFVIDQGAAKPSAPQGNIAYEAAQSVAIDGAVKEFKMYALLDSNGGKTNYIKLRDLASALNGTAAQFEVGYDGKISITTKTAYTPNGSEGNSPYSGNQPYKVNQNAVNVNGKAVSLDSFIITDSTGGGHTYFKLRDLGKALGFNVGWSKAQGVYIETSKPYSES